MPEQTPKRAAEQIGHVDLRRAWRAFLKPGHGQLLVGAVLCLAALLVVWTLRSQASQPDYSNLRRTDLIQLLDNLSSPPLAISLSRGQLVRKPLMMRQGTGPNSCRSSRGLCPPLVLESI